jgi:hypothetical protein
VAVVLFPASALATSLFPDMWQTIVTPAPQGLLAAFDAILEMEHDQPRQLATDGSQSALFRILLIYTGCIGTTLIVTRLPRATPIA